MSQPVFLSYARNASAAHARALAQRLGNLAFLDTDAIDDGDHFPQRLLDGVLGARIVVIFATKTYTERRFCKAEMRLALAAADAKASHLVLALGEGCETLLDVMPRLVATQNWPPAKASERLEDLVRQRLNICRSAIRDRLGAEESQRLVTSFLEESQIRAPQALQGVVCSFPQGVVAQSLGSRFLGRADDLRRIHRLLAEGNGTAQMTYRITAGGGFGKTRLAMEYLHRYGARYYTGGLFWVNAASSSIDGELWRILSTLDAAVPGLDTMHKAKRELRQELERALRGITKPVLYIVDNIPEAGDGEEPARIADFCPALGAVTVLATSRQDTYEEGVETITLATLARDSAILLLTEQVLGAGRLSWADWGRVAEWVGDLPIALDLLNRSLHLNAISAEDLLRRVKPSPALPGAAGELDRLREALRGQVPRDAVHGVTEAFSISFHRLDHASQNTALILAQLAPTPIPDALMDALPEGWKSRAALSSRHFVTGGGDRSFGVMHPLMADFLRSVAKEPKSGWFQTALRALTRVVASDRRSVATGSGSEWFLAACQALSRVMPIDRCRDPDQWPLVTLCRPHAEVLFARGRTLDATVAPSSEIGFLAALLATEQFDYAGARRLYEQVVEVRTRVLGEENQDTLVAMNNLAETLAKLGDGEGQRRIHERVLEVKTRLLGEAHPSTLMTTSNLALTLCLMKEVAEGRRLMERAVQTCTRELGASHLTTLETMSDLAFMLGPHADNAEDQAEVRRLQEQVLEGRTKLLGEAHPDTLEALDNLAWTLQSQRDIAGWRRLRELALDATAGLLGESDPATLKAMNELVWTLEVQGDDAGASRIRERAFEASIRALREERTDALQQMDRLANSLRDPALALQLRERMVEVSARVLGKNAPATLRATRELAADLVGRDPARARQLLEHVLEVSTELFGENHRDTFAAKLWLFQIGPESGNVRESGL